MLDRIRRSGHRIQSPILELVGTSRSQRDRAIRALIADPMNVSALLKSMSDKPNNVERVRQQLMMAFLQAEITSPHVSAVCAEVLRFAKGQLLQDVAAVAATSGKRNGFFVEVGVGDGVYLSNTHLLEKRFGWKGILAEPNPDFHAAIKSSRNTVLDTRAVYEASGRLLSFLKDDSQGELSTLTESARRDAHVRSGTTVDVSTVTMDDLLSEQEVTALDYVSIDTEGSELEVLSGFSLDRWRPVFISIEHNYDSAREGAIDEHMRDFGYQRFMRGRTFFDAWYTDGVLEPFQE